MTFGVANDISLFILFEIQQMILGRSHGVILQLISIFQVTVDFLSGEFHQVKSVFIFIEIEHVPDGNLTLGDFSVHLQDSTERNVCPGFPELGIMYEVGKSRRTEQAFPPR